MSEKTSRNNAIATPKPKVNKPLFKLFLEKREEIPTQVKNKRRPKYLIATLAG